MSSPPPWREGVHRLGPVRLACGRELQEARIGYSSCGTLNATRSNLILVPTAYGGRHADFSWLAGPVLDPDRFCIVVADMFGNGVSSSPSDGSMGISEQGWRLSHRDNVAAQRRLLQEVFAVQSPALIYGWSMGGQQALQWAVDHPSDVPRICSICATARTSPHNRLFLLSLRHALTADRHWHGSGFDGEPIEGLRTYALIYASWAVSQPWFRGLEGSVESHVDEHWLPLYRRHDPRDLIAMIDTWLDHDLAPDGDLPAVLANLSSQVTLVAAGRDLYFTPEDIAADAQHLRHGRLLQLDSLLGHRAGNPRDSAAEQAQLRAAVEHLLSG